MDISRAVKIAALTVVASAAAAGFVAVYARHAPPGVDWHYSFYPFTVSWLHGQPVYTPPLYGVYNPPWLALVLAPLALPGERVGLSVLALVTALALLAGWRVFSRDDDGLARPLALGIALFNLHTVDLFFRGQIDGLVLLGIISLYAGLSRHHAPLVALGWLLQLRPTGSALLLIYSIWLAYRDGYLHRAAVIVAVALVASLALWGVDWPARYLAVVLEGPAPSPWLVTLPTAARALGIASTWATAAATLVAFVTAASVWRYRPDLPTAFALLPAASLLVVPYALSYHYVTILVTAVPLLLRWRPWLAAPLYALTFTSLLRAPFGLDVTPVDIVFPLAAWLLVLVKLRLSAVQQPAGATSAQQISPA